MRIFIFILLFLINFNLYAYDIVYTGGSVASGKLLISDYDSAVLINNSFNAFKEKNSLAVSGSLVKGNFLDEGEKIINFGIIASVAALKQYVNIDIAYNMFSYDFYNNYLLYLGLSRQLGNALGIGTVFKYGGESFTLTYEGETDPAFGENNLTQNNYNIDLSVSYNYRNAVISGISFENILSYKEFFNNNKTYDLPAAVRLNIMAKMFSFSFFNDNYMASEIDILHSDMRIKTGLSLGFYKYFSFQLGYISNESLTTGMGFKLFAGNIKFNLNYGLNYSYNISGLKNIVTVKINY